jgi:DNA-directed RNA polymerase subunit H (RpoH/RPB5)
MTLSPEARAQVERFQADRHSGKAMTRADIASRDSRAHHRRTENEILIVDVGVTVWTDPTKMKDSHEDPVAQQDGALSGVVLEVVAGSVTSDGEVVPDKYRVFNPYSPPGHPRRFARWPSDWVDIWRTEATPMPLLARYMRTLFGIVAAGKSLPAGDDARIAEDAQRLLRLLMSEGGHR